MLHPMRVENGAWLAAGIAHHRHRGEQRLLGARGLVAGADVQRGHEAAGDDRPDHHARLRDHRRARDGADDRRRSPDRTICTRCWAATPRSRPSSSEYLPAFGLKLVSISIAIAIFNACLAGFIGIGRNVFSMGRTKLFARPINRALMQQIPSTDAPWVAICLIGASTAIATYIPLVFQGPAALGQLHDHHHLLRLGRARRAAQRGGRAGHAYRTPPSR